MQILIKVVGAILLGIIMLLVLMLLVNFTLFVVGYLALLVGLNNLANASFKGQKHIWLKTKQWFFRYKNISK